jgi:hypothetical protein
MDISSATQHQISSVRQALSMSTLQKSMGQDGATVNKLIEGMEETTKAVQTAAEPYKGNNIDVKV